MTYQIKLTQRALADLDRLAGSLSPGLTGDAESLTRRFLESLVRLERLPMSCGLAYENRYFREEIRHLLF